MPYANIPYLTAPSGLPGGPWSGGSDVGSYWGSGPGLDWGDIAGPNSIWSNLFGGGGLGGGGDVGGGVGSWWPGQGLAPGTMPQLPSGAGGCAIGSPFSAGMPTARASLFAIPNPATGRLTWFRPAGRPVLFSGDFAACRRVRKLARRARSRVGGR